MRTSFILVIGLAVGSSASAQIIELAESPREGDTFRFSIETNLTGTLKVTRDGKPASLKITAKNEHAFVEKTLSVEKGSPRKTVRHYGTAKSSANIDGDKVERTLAADHKLIVMQRNSDGPFCYSPAGPLMRSELEVVSEHFDTLNIAGILPNRLVRVGDSWKLDAGVAQALCLFDGLISYDLMVKLKSADEKSAVLTIEGGAKGIENGAMANLNITASLTYDLAKKRIVALEWKQKDSRDQGPASPAAEVETITTLKRDVLDREPEELSATALMQLPTGAELPTTMQHLAHRDPRGRFQFVHAREWYVVGQTDYHLIMRLIDRGDFLAQATLTVWKNAGAGKHMSAAEFEKLVAEGTGWKMEQVVDRSEIPTDGGRWIYRITANGELEGIKVVQHFYVVANAAGEQMICTFTMKPNTVERIGTRDVAIVNAIDFPKP